MVHRELIERNGFAIPFVTKLVAVAINTKNMKGVQMENERKEKEVIVDDSRECQEPAILEEVNIEELAVDGICGIY